MQEMLIKPRSLFRYTRRAGACLFLAGLMLGLVSSPLRAQEPAPALTVNVDSSAYPDIRAVVTARDARGIPASGLAVESFDVSGGDDISIVDVTSAQDSSLALSTVLVIDTSGSMEGAPLQAAQAAATQFVNQLGQNEQAAVVAFSDGVREVVPLTADKGQLIAGINSLTALGPTSLYDAVQAGVYAARSFDAPRQAVVILSDGENDTAAVTATEVGSLDIARNAAVPVFAIGFGGASDTGYLQRLATETQGSFFAADAGDVGSVYATIGSRLRNQYVLNLRSTAPPDGQQASLALSAVIDGQTVVSAPATYLRGAAPVVPPAPPVVEAPPAPAADEGSGGSSNAPLIAIAAIAALTVATFGAFTGGRRARAARAQRQREQHAGQQSDQALPDFVPATSTGETPSPVRAHVVKVDGPEAGKVIVVGEVPVVLGSDAAADVQLSGAGVAARHATVRVVNGKVALRHTGGARPTLVGGMPIDVVMLEDGDEFAIGGYRFRASVESAMPVP